MEPPLPSSDTLALPPRIQPQVGGTGFDPLPKKREMEKKPPFLEVSLLLWAKGGLGKWPTPPLSLQKKRKRRVYRLPRSGVLDLEPPLPRLRGEHSSQVGFCWVSSREGKVPFSKVSLTLQRLGPLAATPALRRIPPVPAQAPTTPHQPSPWKRFQWPRHAWAVLRWAPQEPGAESLGWRCRHVRRPCS